jgi:hypothetical protein
VIESRDFSSPLDELESLIRSAGQYVRASDDLRPRVLENARWQCSERRLQLRFWQTAAVVLLCGMLTSSLLDRSEPTASSTTHTAGWTSPMLAPVEAATRSSDPSWQMVESFTQLRLRQAQLLRL